MADNPRYQRANVVYADMPNLQPVDLQEQLASNRRIGAALDQMTNITGDIAKRYAVEAAGRYSIENPVTTQQLLDAQKNNENPIAGNLKGGTIYNDTLKKIYAQQASSELTNLAYTHFEDVLKQVENGTLADPESIKQSLNAIIKPQTQVLSNIDVETGLAYDAKVTSYANTYFKQANKEIERQSRERIDLLSQDTINAQVKMFERDVLTETDPVILKEKLNLRLADGYTTFKQGNHALALNNQLEQKLNYVLNNKFAEYIANVAGSEANAVKMLEKGNAKAYTKFWQSKTPDEKDDLRDFVLKEIRFKNAGAAEFESQFRAKLSMGKQMLLNGEEPSADLSKWLITNAGSLRPDSAVRSEAEIFNMQIQEYRKLNSMSLTDRQAYEEKVLAKIGSNMTPENYSVYNFIKESNSKFRDSLSKDPVGTMKKQEKYRGSVLDFSLPDSQFQDQVDNRVKLAGQFTKTNGVKTKFLDEGEIESYRSLYESSDAQGKQLLAGRIVKTFGQNAGVVFDQLAPKDPIMGHLGGLFINQSDKDILDRVVKGQDIIKSGTKYDTSDTRESAAIRTVIGDAYYNAPKLQNGVVETAKALYAEEAIRKGYKTFNQSAFEEKLQEASGRKTGPDGSMYGGIIKYNGTRITVPSSIPMDEFKNVMDKATIADFRYASDNFANRKNTNGLFDERNNEYTSEKIKDAVLIPIDNNRAKLRIGNGLFVLKGGHDLVINLDVLYRKLKDENRL